MATMTIPTLAWAPGHPYADAGRCRVYGLHRDKDDNVGSAESAAGPRSWFWRHGIYRFGRLRLKGTEVRLCYMADAVPQTSYREIAMTP